MYKVNGWEILAQLTVRFYSPPKKKRVYCYDEENTFYYKQRNLVQCIYRLNPNYEASVKVCGGEEAPAAISQAASPLC